MTDPDDECGDGDCGICNGDIDWTAMGWEKETDSL